MITVVMHFGGQFSHIPYAQYIGGSIRVYDWVNSMNLKNAELKMFSDAIGLDEFRRLYIIINKAWRLLGDDVDVKNRGMKHVIAREMHVYVQVLESTISSQSEPNVDQNTQNVETTWVDEGDVQNGEEGTCDDDELFDQQLDEIENGHLQGPKDNIECDRDESSVLKPTKKFMHLQLWELAESKNGVSLSISLHCLQTLEGACRPSRARRREVDEPNLKRKKSIGNNVMKMKRQQKTLKCRRCGIQGHNASSCPDKDVHNQSGEEVLLNRRRKLQVRKKNVAPNMDEPYLTGSATDILSNDVLHDPNDDVLHDVTTRDEGTSQTTSLNPIKPNILPPSRDLEVETAQDEEWAQLSQITAQSSVPHPHVTIKQGPTVYQQLHMGKSMTYQQPRLQPKIQIRAPLPFTD
ncbi:hypothetical protein DH2020_008629 [Rehmannia glutinosa]|uniref:CCHC-type domain-containing protein n=1 Tax=Rehmannia glutinosa TaxID=99300 RepID=A0ABR0X6H4_REHGL